MCNCGTSRRKILAGLLVAPLGLSGCLSGGGEDDSAPDSPPGSDPPSTRVTFGGAGCYRPGYANAPAADFGCGVLPNFGVPAIDLPSPEEIQLQATFFSGIAAQVHPLDECSPANANALATPTGFILIGRYFASNLLQRMGNTLPIAGVIAHEWAHRTQFSLGWMVQTEPTVRRTELEADMWSGLYMGVMKSWTGLLMQSYFQTLLDIGDFNFNSPNHHGTPNQRHAAGATGLALASQLMQSNTRLSYEQIHALFVNEVTRITTTIQKSEMRTDSLDSVTQQVARGMDTEWIRGIAVGKRRLSEHTAMPSLPLADRINLGPY